jgi:hypothetical protein
MTRHKHAWQGGKGDRLAGHLGEEDASGGGRAELGLHQRRGHVTRAGRRGPGNEFETSLKETGLEGIKALHCPTVIGQ